MKVRIPYGDKYKEVSINKKNLIGIIEALDAKPVKDERIAIRNALNNPIHCKKINEIAKEKSNAVIVVNDITRPTPSKLLIEELSKKLNESDIKDSNIQIVVATGIHRKNSREELISMLGKENVNRFNIINHDCRDKLNIKFIGKTKRELPIYINKIVVNADIKILTGVIVPHHSAGFSGGRKSILPGVSGYETLKIHHSFPIRPYRPVMGILDSNPFHEEALEATKMLGIDFIINVVQNSKKETVSVVAGDLDIAHKKGVEISKKICEVSIFERPDIVITSPGGYPRDIDLYQAQKAISPVENIIRENGVIILVAECRDGIGKEETLSWLKKAKDPQEVIKRFSKEGFLLGSHKAFLFARAIMKNQIILVTENISGKDIKDMFMIKKDSLQNALIYAYKITNINSRVLVLPKANYIIPKIE